MALIGTPFGLSHSGDIEGHWLMLVVNLEFGCAPFPPKSDSQSSPFQFVDLLGASSPEPSHHTVPSSFKTTFVKNVFCCIVFIAFGFVFMLVPGTTPKNPASGLTAHSLPSFPICIHAISSPIVQIFQPGIE